MEAHLPGVSALRLGCPIAWDNPRRKVAGEPEADRWIPRAYRTKWLS